jgi:hypothetical protein
VRTERLLWSAFFAFAVSTIAGGVASAHHSRAGYDSDDKQLTLKGIVTEYKWKNPHVFIVWDTKDANGKVVQWVGELSSVSTMISEGMNKQSLKPGDEILVTAVPAKEGKPQSLIRKVVKPDGKVVVDMSRRDIREP